MAGPSFCEECSELEPVKWQDGPRTAKWKKSITAARLSAQNGCLGCRYFLQILEGAYDDDDDNQMGSLELWQPHGWPYLNLIFPGGGGVQLDACEVQTGNDGKSETPSKESWINSSKAVAYIPRLVSGDPTSTETVQIAKDWINLCSEHEGCAKQHQGPMPTRVIKVTEGENLRLCLGEDLRGDYVTLSHCWGDAGPPTKTETSNLEKHLHEIDEDRLPANFKDAIAFTRLLGYEYLWIDALCIIQDDRDDWRNESAQMASYYHNAAVTLSAACASSCDEGFLHERSWLPSSPPFGKDKKYCLRLATDEGELEESPINKRAWTLQERFLSPRIIHFLEDILVWECGSYTRTEGLLQNDITERDEQPLRTKVHLLLDEDLFYENGRRRNPESLSDWETPTCMQGYDCQSWWKCVHEFTQRSIKFPSDRLPAIAGLAHAIGKQRFGRYLAGLWEGDFFRQLCWHEAGADRTSSELDDPFHWPREHVSPTMQKRAWTSVPYRAPSWSWAAFDGAVETPKGIWFPNNRRGPFIQLHHEHNHWEGVYSPSLVDVNMISQGGNHYVNLCEGTHVEIDGFCREVYLTECDAATSRRRHWPIVPSGLLWINDINNCSSSSSTLKSGVIQSVIIDNMDNDKAMIASFEDTTSGQPLGTNKAKSARKCLILQICKEWHGDRLVWALIMEKVQNQDHGDSYRRIGLISLAYYNLCEFQALKPNMFIPADTLMHPMERNGGKRLQDEMNTTEWRQEKWEKRRIRLY